MAGAKEFLRDLLEPKWFVQTLADVKRHEGCRLTSYWDDIGKCWTIGWGHTKGVIQNTKITQDEADRLLKEDLRDALAETYKVVHGFEGLDWVRKTVLLNMCINMGGPTLRTFEKFLGYVNLGDYETAALEMMHSRWAAQVKGRAVELSKRMRTGVIA